MAIYLASTFDPNVFKVGKMRDNDPSRLWFRYQSYYGNPEFWIFPSDVADLDEKIVLEKFYRDRIGRSELIRGDKQAILGCISGITGQPICRPFGRSDMVGLTYACQVARTHRNKLKKLRLASL